MKGSAGTGARPRKSWIAKLPWLDKTFKSDEEFYEAYRQPEIQQLPIEQRRLALFQVPDRTFLYDSGRPLYYLVSVHGKSVLLCLQRAEFWFLFGLCAIISVVYFRELGFTARLNKPTAAGWPNASYALLSIPTALLSFLIVFFINSAYQRYITQYLRCHKMVDTLSRLRLAFRVHFVDEAFEGAREVRHSLLKLLCAAHAIAYAGLPQQRKIRMHLWVYEYLLEKGLLTQQQLDHLKPLVMMADGRFAMTEVFQWINRGFWGHLGQGRSDFECKGMLQMSAKVYEARQHMEYLYAMAAAPIPFVWFNLMSVYISVYLSMLAYLFAFFDGPYYSLASYFLILLAFLSLRELGCVLSDPFGQDACDIPVFELVFQFDKETLRLADVKPLEDNHMDFFQLTDEDYMALKSERAR